MSNQIYEIHLTFIASLADTVQQLCLTEGWKFSRILGDPVLGDKEFCYASEHRRFPAEALKLRETMVAKCVLQGIPVLRSKVEMVLYDSRDAQSDEPSKPAAEWPFPKP